MISRPPEPKQEPATEERASRRNMIGALAACLGAIGGLLIAPKVAARQMAKRGRGPVRGAGKGPRKPRWGMVIDLDLCTGCEACVVSCRSENNVPYGGFGEAHRGRSSEWMTLMRKTKGKYPKLAVSVYPMPCNHCETPACTKVCPVGATYISEEGIVAQIWDQCIGCRYCMMACPYSRRYFNWFKAPWPDEHRPLLNPDVATRPVGVVEKCTFCHHRIRRKREQARLEKRPLRDGDIQTACEEVCPARAITFGDLDDPESRVARSSSSPRAFRLLEKVGTQPKVYYLAKDYTE